MKYLFTSKDGTVIGDAILKSTPVLTKSCNASSIGFVLGSCMTSQVVMSISVEDTEVYSLMGKEFSMYASTQYEHVEDSPAAVFHPFEMRQQRNAIWSYLRGVNYKLVIANLEDYTTVFTYVDETDTITYDFTITDDNGLHERYDGAYLTTEYYSGMYTLCLYMMSVSGKVVKYIIGIDAYVRIGEISVSEFNKASVIRYAQQKRAMEGNNILFAANIYDSKVESYSKYVYNYVLLGNFTVTDIEKSEDGLYSLTLKDQLYKAEQDASLWLSADSTHDINTVDSWKGLDRLYPNQSWVSADAVAHSICNRCKIPYHTGLGANVKIYKNAADFRAVKGITGRELLQYVAELAGAYGACDKYGYFSLYWFTEKDKTITPAEYKSLLMQDFTANDIDGAEIVSNSTGDVSLSAGGSENPYVVTNNIFVNSRALTIDIIQPIYNALSEYKNGKYTGKLKYTPYEAELLPDLTLDVGQIITIEDSKGNTFESPVFDLTLSDTMNISAAGEITVSQSVNKETTAIKQKIYE